MKINDVDFNDNGEIIDTLTGKILKDTPEERVRQSFINILQSDYGYPKANILREVPIQSGSKILLDTSGAEIRADIVVYTSKKAALEKDQGNILFVVECKKPTASEGYAQLVSYIFNTSAVGGVWTNGNGLSVYKKRTGKDVGLDEILSLPRYREDWKGDDIIPSKQSLPRPHNIRFLLASCHNKLYGRGMENEDFDLAMDMVRILLAKIQDETTPGDFPRFWITESDFKTAEGRKHAADNIQKLFREYADQFPDVFDAYEKIQVGDDCIAEAVGILKNWSLAARNDDADDWDLMGETYEQFTHINLKRQQGQFFTNRLVIDMMVKMLDPKVGEHSLDPAGGSGGFATAIFRYLRRKVINSTAENSPVRERQLANIKDSVYLVEIASRLVKIAKCAMLLTGDGQSGMTRGNSLDSYDHLDPWIISRCAKGKSNAPSVIATNPPFSGQKVESQISDKTILKSFVFGHSYKKQKNGEFTFSMDDSDILLHQAPELLFLERCLDWLKPGGRMGIVLPKGILDNVSYEPYRLWLMQHCQINGIVTLHKDTFQPDTGVRTCVLFVTKPENGEKPPELYNIFMAMSQRIGQDSKGNSVFVLDGNGNSTGILNHDLDEIAEAYLEFRKGKELKESEYIFTISSKDIKDHCNINPQHYAPKLNEALTAVLKYDNRDKWATTTVGQLEAGIRIYIGPRWNSANLKVDNPADTSGLIPYLTANAALELRRFTIKWIDPTKASPSQKVAMQLLKIKEGDILISRSGTIGKVTYATKDLAENYLVSDDLVRVRVKNPELRAYLLAYFTSQTALSLMLLDEYGSVQQHLQPRHIQEMLIPLPDDWEMVSSVIAAGKKFISAMESMSVADKLIRTAGFDAIITNNIEENKLEEPSDTEN
ncbi:N-6 DNA methylase [Acidaminococcus fermentans]|uniref:N-6 DNA methylase n=1 Tax=Acidaminococcus fermentans TaxID=905 RepID=UPI002E7A8ECB|nr:N-6 DNA methylase [Acidaminococcus fermentans]MEE1597454.1 N-6 DNA methylase [Acidaminococcus fermentans]MEE4121717.1 N-6 DNA methylase [Acidaminococcus fermentans]